MYTEEENYALEDDEAYGPVLFKGLTAQNDNMTLVDFGWAGMGIHEESCAEHCFAIGHLPAGVLLGLARTQTGNTLLNWEEAHITVYQYWYPPIEQIGGIADETPFCWSNFSLRPDKPSDALRDAFVIPATILRHGAWAIECGPGVRVANLLKFHCARHRDWLTGAVEGAAVSPSDLNLFGQPGYSVIGVQKNRGAQDEQLLEWPTGDFEEAISQMQVWRQRGATGLTLLRHDIGVTDADLRPDVIAKIRRYIRECGPDVYLNDLLSSLDDGSDDDFELVGTLVEIDAPPHGDESCTDSIPSPGRPTQRSIAKAPLELLPPRRLVLAHPVEKSLSYSVEVNPIKGRNEIHFVLIPYDHKAGPAIVRDHERATCLPIILAYLNECIGRRVAKLFFYAMGERYWQSFSFSYYENTLIHQDWPGCEPDDALVGMTVFEISGTDLDPRYLADDTSSHPFVYWHQARASEVAIYQRFWGKINRKRQVRRSRVRVGALHYEKKDHYEGQFVFALDRERLKDKIANLEVAGYNTRSRIYRGAERIGWGCYVFRIARTDHELEVVEPGTVVLPTSDWSDWKAKCLAAGAVVTEIDPARAEMRLPTEVDLSKPQGGPGKLLRRGQYAIDLSQQDTPQQEAE